MEKVEELVKKLKESSEYKNIKENLLDQLKRKNAHTPVFVSQVNDYMAMWVTKEMLIMDIEKRGAYTTYDNGGGQKGSKKNDSVSEQAKINSQMLKLLEALDITSTSLIADDNDDL